jgi:hypothetical protein
MKTHIIKKIVGESTLTYEEFATEFYRIEACLTNNFHNMLSIRH